MLATAQASADIFLHSRWPETEAETLRDELTGSGHRAFLLSQAFARSLDRQAGGQIISLLDWRALRPKSDHLAYTISKAGLAV